MMESATPEPASTGGLALSRGKLRDGEPRWGLHTTELWCTLILALNYTWCSLEGHGSGFMEAASAIDPYVNSRAFWLLGLTAMTLLFIVAPGWWLHRNRWTQAVMPVLGCLGTLLFAGIWGAASSASLSLAVLGLFLSGLVQFWTSARVVLLEARTAPFAAIVVMLVLAVVVKTGMVMVLPFAVPAFGQVVFAACIPLLNGALFCVARHSAGRRSDTPCASRGARPCSPESQGARTVFGVAALPRGEALGPRSKRDFVLLIAMAAFLLATVRRLSFWGMWGAYAAFDGGVFSRLLELVVTVVVLGLFSWLCLIKTQGLPVAFRFQPAVVFVVAGLFAASAPLPAALSPVTSVILHVEESCAYVLFWAVMALSLDLQRIRSFRLLGLGGLAFGLLSLVWVVGSAFVDEIGGAWIALVAYVVIVMATLFGYWETRREGAHGVAVPSADPSASTCAAEPCSPSLAGSLSERASALAVSYGLTARETEVLQLLVQGRTRAFIQNELVLSVGTVKTHVTHIYAKLGVNDRQGLMDLVLEKG